MPPSYETIVPYGLNDNSPAIYRWVNESREARSPVSMIRLSGVNVAWSSSGPLLSASAPRRGRGRGGWGRAAPSKTLSLVKTAFHVSIRTPRHGVGSTMSHPSGGSRRDTALLSGATPTQANGASACDARCGLRCPRPWFTVLRVGRAASPFPLSTTHRGWDITKRFILD